MVMIQVEPNFWIHAVSFTFGIGLFVKATRMTTLLGNRIGKDTQGRADQTQGEGEGQSERRGRWSNLRL